MDIEEVLLIYDAKPASLPPSGLLLLPHPLLPVYSLLHLLLCLRLLFHDLLLLLLLLLLAIHEIEHCRAFGPCSILHMTPTSLLVCVERNRY